MALSHRKGRKAKTYPHDVGTIARYVVYDPDTGELATSEPFASHGTVAKDGHVMLAVPMSESVERGERVTEYFRADHIAWMMVTGEWPTGWMEHINGLKQDLKLDNLVHVTPEGIRWWYGAQISGEPRELVTVEAADGLRSDGPLLFFVDDKGGQRLQPLVSEQYRKVEPPEDLIEDDDDGPGEFGIDWGYNIFREDEHR